MENISEKTRRQIAAKGYILQDGFVMSNLPVPPNCLRAYNVLDETLMCSPVSTFWDSSLIYFWLHQNFLHFILTPEFFSPFFRMPPQTCWGKSYSTYMESTAQGLAPQPSKNMRWKQMIFRLPLLTTSSMQEQQGYVDNMQMKCILSTWSKLCVHIWCHVSFIGSSRYHL